MDHQSRVPIKGVIFRVAHTVHADVILEEVGGVVGLRQVTRRRQ